jgi:hypothetical protein
MELFCKSRIFRELIFLISIRIEPVNLLELNSNTSKVLSNPMSIAIDPFKLLLLILLATEKMCTLLTTTNPSQTVCTTYTVLCSSSQTHE